MHKPFIVLILLIALSCANDSNEGPSVEGSLSKASVDQSITANIEKVRKCYEAELVKLGHLSGELDVGWIISSEGNATSVSIMKNTFTSDAVADCVAKAISQIQFEKPKTGDVIVKRYPFQFSS